MADLDLKPCPFCGTRKAEIRQAVPAPGYWVLCWECHVSTATEASPKVAAREWNRRESPTEDQ